MGLAIWRTIFLSLLLGGGAALADISLPASVSAPPQVDGQSVRVLRGRQITIALRGHYGGSASASFVIVRPPVHGKLSDLRSLGQNQASITYSHSGDEAAADGFTFILKAGGRVSSPAEIRVSIEEAPPRLEAPEQLDFGEILAGEKASQSLPIRNAGGGTLEGRVTISSPWHVSPNEYRVAAGETEMATVTFEPNESKTFVGQLTLTNSDGKASTVALQGSATSPAGLAISPSAPSAVPASTDTPSAAVAAATMNAGQTEPATSTAPIPAPTAISSSIPDPTMTPLEAAEPELPANAGVKVTAHRLSSTTWGLQWPAEKRPGATYRIEERLLSLDVNHELQTTWREVATPKISANVDPVTAEVAQLDALQLHMLRVTAVDRDGTALWEAPLVALAAEPRPPRNHSYWLWILGGLLASFVFLRWRTGRLPA